MTAIGLPAARRVLLLGALGMGLSACCGWPAARDAAPQARLAGLGLQLLRVQAVGNAVVAPYNAAAALELLRAGAAGDTAAQIGRLAGPLDWAAVGAEGAEGGPWRTAQRLWLAPPAQLRPEFLVAARARGADAVSWPGGEALINTWAAEQTAGKITALLAPGSLAPTTRMVLTTTAHFKAAWRQPFAASRTALAPFHNADGSTAQAPTMRATMTLRTGQMGGYRLVELPFAAKDYALLLALPDGAPGNPLAATLDGAQLSGWRSSLQAGQVELHLPRFAVRSASVSVKSALQRAGMTAAFSPAADFSPISGQRDMMLGDLLQAAAIEVDEFGAEAVAAGAASLVVKSLPPPDALPLRFDRPFLFALVRTDSDAVLFLGAVSRLGE